MSDPSFNLHQLAIRPNWYDHLGTVEAAIAAEHHIHKVRLAAGWTPDEDCWLSPNGITDSAWEHEHGFPFPEDPSYEAFLLSHGPLVA